MNTSLNIAIAGVAGRMGRELVRAAIARGHGISGGTERRQDPSLGRAIGGLIGDQTVTSLVSERVQTAAEGGVCWIDFTAPVATLGDRIVVGDEHQRAAMLGA